MERIMSSDDFIDDTEVTRSEVSSLFKDELSVKDIFERLDLILMEVTKLTQRVYILETKLYTDPRVATWLRTIK